MRDSGKGVGRGKRLTVAGLAVGVVAGVLLWNGFTWALDYTNTVEFCTSCHTMRDNVYAELQDSPHWSNPSGVRVECAQCHVPHAFVPKMKRKILAVNDIYHEIMGMIDTKEKFEARRRELAERVWDYMRASDSRECRTCHSFEAMDVRAQTVSARRKHPAAMKEGDTCIDCHKGVAHKLPRYDD